MDATRVSLADQAEIAALLRELVAICDSRLTLAQDLHRRGHTPAAVAIITTAGPLRARGLRALSRLSPDRGAVH